MTEVWKPIDGYEGLYEVSDAGRIRGLRLKKVLKPQNKNGYNAVNLSKKGVVHQVYVHRLVASAFIDNPLSFPCIDHKDCNKRNNNVCNLEWCTAKENAQRAWKNGLTPHPPRVTCEDHRNHVLTRLQVSEIRKTYATNEVTQRHLAKQYGVSQRTICSIVNNQTWRELQNDII